MTSGARAGEEPGGKAGRKASGDLSQGEQAGGPVASRVGPATPGRTRGPAREVLAAAVASLLLVVVVKWRVVTHLGSGLPGDLGDPLLQTWQLAWGPHALLHQLTHPFDANAFWPLHRSLAFSDSLLGLAPLGLLFGAGPAAAVARYDTVYLLSYAAATTAAYCLARQLGASRGAAAVAGVAFAYAPWHLAQEGHLQILLTAGLPASLALLARGHGIGGPARPRLVVAGWAVAAWQVSLGFGLGLQLTYALGALTVLVTARHAVRRRRGRTGPAPRALLGAEIVGLVGFLTTAVAFGRPYLQVVAEHPEARRRLAEVSLYSPPAHAFATTAANNWLWGHAQAGLRSSLASQSEGDLAVGGMLLLLAVLGLVRGNWSRAARWSLAGAAVGVAAFAMGTKLAGGRFSYLLLYDHAPGWQGVRTPGRLVVLVTLALALLAATGIDGALSRSSRFLRRTMPVLLAATVLLEGLGSTATPTAPQIPAGVAGAPGPVLVLPSDEFHDSWAMWFSTDGFGPLVNGASGFVPVGLAALRRDVVGFPDAGSVELLRRRGIRRVVLVPAYAKHSPWQDAAVKPVAGLPLVRRQERDSVVFDLQLAG